MSSTRLFALTTVFGLVWGPAALAADPAPLATTSAAAAAAAGVAGTSNSSPAAVNNRANSTNSVAQNKARNLAASKAPGGDAANKIKAAAPPVQKRAK